MTEANEDELKRDFDIQLKAYGEEIGLSKHYEQGANWATSTFFTLVAAVFLSTTIRNIDQHSNTGSSAVVAVVKISLFVLTVIRFSSEMRATVHRIRADACLKFASHHAGSLRIFSKSATEEMSDILKTRTFVLRWLSKLLSLEYGSFITSSMFMIALAVAIWF